MTDVATDDERIIDGTYEAVFVLSKAQIESNVCSLDPARKGMTNMRVTRNGDDITCESTNGKCAIRVTDKVSSNPLKHYPYDVNPSENPEPVINEPQFIPGAVLEELAKGFPKRKNFSAEAWQRAVVFSVAGKTFEVGRSNKQGKPEVDSYDKSPHTAFPPLESIQPTTDPAMVANFDIKLLQTALAKMEAAGAELVSIKLWSATHALVMDSVNKYGHATARVIQAYVMPIEKGA